MGGGHTQVRPGGTQQKPSHPHPMGAQPQHGAGSVMSHAPSHQQQTQSSLLQQQAVAKPVKAAVNLALATPGQDELKVIAPSNLPIKVVPAMQPKLELTQTRATMHMIANDPNEKLVPVRLNLMCEGLTLRDTFIWRFESNPKEHKSTPEQFARQLCDETDLPRTFEPLIIQAINDQINEFLEQDSKAHELVTKNIDDAAYGCSGELLLKIKLDVRVNDFLLQDAFIWDLKQSGNSPEVFAKAYVDDLELPSEVVGIVAHAIREQIKEAYTKIERADDAGLLKSVRVRWRESDKLSWSPDVNWLQQGERENYEQQQRYKRQKFYGGHKPGVRATMPSMPAPGMPRGLGAR